MSKRTLGILALLFATFLWGPAPVLTKLGVSEIPPYSLAFLRFALALILILPIFFVKGYHRITKEDLGQVLMVGLFGSGLNTLFFMSGIAKTQASTAAAIFATVPLVNAVAASLILREKPTLVRVLGVIVGFFGSFMIAVGPNFLNNSQFGGDSLGNLLIAGAVFSWVAFIITSKELLKKYTPVTITTYSFLVGSLVVLPLAFTELLQQPAWYLQVSWAGISSVIYGGFFASVLAFLSFQWGIKQTSAFEAGIVTYLNPVLATLWAIPILGEKPTPLFLLGTGLILGGVFLATTYELIQKRNRPT